MNKREFVLILGSGLVAGSQPAAAAMSRTGTEGPAVWRSRLGARFKVLDAPTAVVLTLQRVDEIHADAALEQYTLLFSAQGGPLDAGTRIVEAEDGPLLVLYLDDGGGNPDGKSLWRAHFSSPCQRSATRDA